MTGLAGGYSQTALTSAIFDKDAIGIAGVIADGGSTPAEETERALQLAERFNPHLQCISFLDADGARARAQGALSGPLAGVPMLLKDAGAAKKGWPMRSGSRLVPEMRAPSDSWLVERFEAAGAVLVGRTTMCEFGLFSDSWSTISGAARNPWSLAHNPGGSSGGSAAAVAAGIVAIAHASDGGGSIRGPASRCGIVGFKPSRGMVPIGPGAGDVTGGLYHEHVLTRSVRDSALALDVATFHVPGEAPPPAAPPGGFLAALRRPPRRLRIVVTGEGPEGSWTDPACAAAARDAAQLVASLGHEVVEDRPPPFGAAATAFAELWVILAAVSIDSVAQMTGRLPADGELTQRAAALAAIGRTLPAAKVFGAWAQLQRHARAVGQWLFDGGYDIWITPTLQTPAEPMDVIEARVNATAVNLEELLVEASFAPIMNATGQPAISLPLAWSADELPIGIQFAAAPGADMLLLQLANQIEAAAPWRRGPPNGLKGLIGGRSETVLS